VVELQLDLLEQQNLGEDELFILEVGVVLGDFGHLSDFIVRQTHGPDFQTFQKLAIEVEFILKGGFDLRVDELTSCHTLVTRDVGNFREDLLDKGSVMRDDDCVDVSLPDEGAEQGEVELFLREMVGDVGEH
jgi:hypothetical protein